MIKIKVIDLLNKIANGEEVPKKILFFQDEFIYNEENKDWLNKEHNVGLIQYNFPYTLNNEVEIIEDKKIEKLNELNNESDESKRLRNKINEIIDYLEENK